MSKQAQLFGEWKRLAFNIESLNRFIQNDFDDMLKDGYCTLEEIIIAKEQFRLDALGQIDALTKLYDKTNNFLEEYINNHE